MYALGTEPNGTENKTAALFDVNNLSVQINGQGVSFNVVDHLSFQLMAGESLAIVGESGSGKSVSMQALLGLHAGNHNIAVSGSVHLEGQELLSLSKKDMRKIRGERISLIAQDALAAMNPSLTVGFQITEPLMVHRGMSRKDANRRATELLDLVGIPAAASRLNDYPHEFSGGMRQRALIAMGLVLDPDILIADEPTTALDVTIQAQVLDLLNRLRKDLGMALIIITHDMGVVARVAERVLVMYSGTVVESGGVREVFRKPVHPYTEALLRAMPRMDQGDERLFSIAGFPPTPGQLPQGCRFHPRCHYARDECSQAPAPLLEISPSQATACRFWAENITEPRQETKRA
ncbi:ABC transporter ATP-binding protein [Arthrobacter sp. S39]|uniref:ABC transporter ATP-binding protein n=1 Tax=Arthrobacter sp. S39 TaxID=2509720 RepID=UPI00103717FF|nr:ABC transporter ATP-binding protein [Arthrobacter sp. S39]TAP43196.1 ABC transporter ATP-binding protein [Arthrobacter sp. S39]